MCLLGVWLSHYTVIISSLLCPFPLPLPQPAAAAAASGGTPTNPKLEDLSIIGPAWEEDEFDVHMGFFADMDGDSNGFITSEEMGEYAKSVGMDVTPERIKELISDKDVDHDGTGGSS